MQLKTIIIDDEDLAVDLIEHLLVDYAEIKIIGKYYSSVQALKAIEILKPDLIFSDIQMPKLNGIQLVAKLNYNPLIIFTTAYNHYAVNAFDLNVLDYIVKPIATERFKKAVTKAITQFQLQQYASMVSKNEKYIILKKDGMEHTVYYSDITHIEGLKQYAIVHAGINKFYLNETLKKLEIYFFAFGFIRAHKSFIVNKNKISKIKAQVLLISTYQIPIGRLYKSNINSLVSQQI
jgi:DNA-binding LytR/AlgR family response regulator